MAHKQYLKPNEARILVYLQQVNPELTYTKAITTKLGIDYAYTLNTLHQMANKQWLRRRKQDNKIYYTTTSKAPTQEAISAIRGGK